MKLLMFTREFPPLGSGVGTYCFELANAISELGLNVIVLTTQYRTEDRVSNPDLPFKIVRFRRINGIGERVLGLFYFLFLMAIFRPNKILISEMWAQEVARVWP